MTLQVWFQDDVRAHVLATVVATLSTSIAHGGTNREYVRGALDVARATALSFGVPWDTVFVAIRESLKAGGCLDASTLLDA